MTPKPESTSAKAHISSKQIAPIFSPSYSDIDHILVPMAIMLQHQTKSAEKKTPLICLAAEHVSNQATQARDHSLVLQWPPEVSCAKLTHQMGKLF